MRGKLARLALLGRGPAGLVGRLGARPGLAARTLGPRGARKIVAKHALLANLKASIHSRAAALNSRKAKVAASKAAMQGFLAALHTKKAVRGLTKGKQARLF